MNVQRGSVNYTQGLSSGLGPTDKQRNKVKYRDKLTVQQASAMLPSDHRVQGAAID